MAFLSSADSFPQRNGVPWPIQVAAWSLGLVAAIAGMLGLVAEWDGEVATWQVLWLAMAPVLVMLPARRAAKSFVAIPIPPRLAVDWLASLVIGAVSFAMSAGVGFAIGDLPPAYHDEYSYLFQAETLLHGRFSLPSPHVHPELFDQMHVLNEGRMASRYYPGTGVWMMPFVALGHPYLGHWLAGAVATILIYWTGRELGGRFVACLSSLLLALSPGVALFGNMLLAHHPTLVGLAVFLLGISRWQRTRSRGDAVTAGCGLSFAMLCRPMTAAGVGLPFGLAVLWWLVRGDGLREGTTLPLPSSPTAEGDAPTRKDACSQSRQWWATLCGLGLPLICGWCVMLDYNHEVTGSWLSSPYQVYTNLYTPRHVYGFNNVVRGERHLGPKVIEHYDRWAENLTPVLAASNALTRWVASWLWTVDLLPLLMATVVLLAMIRKIERPWLLIGTAIVTLHLVHVPYWYVGIMGWHYVFESAPLWCLLLADVTRRLFDDWDRSRRRGLKLWWLGLVGLSLAGSYFGPADPGPPRLVRGMRSLIHPRRQQAEFRRWLEASVDQGPALVLVDQRDTEATHLDFVTNSPGLMGRILLGRYREGETNVAQIALDFPDRSIYVCQPVKKVLIRERSAKTSPLDL